MSVTHTKTRLLSWPTIHLGTLCACVCAGIAAGSIVAALPWQLAVMVSAGVLAITLSFARPLISFYGFMCALVIMTGTSNSGHPIAWPMHDIDVITGLPSALWLYFLLLCGVFTLRFLLVDSRRSTLSLNYLWLYIGILLIAHIRGIIAGWNPAIRRTDLMNLLFPVLFAYLCMNVLDTREKLYRAIHILFGVSVIKALALSGFFVTGHGVLFAVAAGETTSQVVTLDSAVLLTSVGMILLALAWVASGRLSSVRKFFVLLASVPMVFLVVFSYRRAEWLGMGGGIVALYMMSTSRERHRLVSGIRVSLMVLFLAGALGVQYVGASTTVEHLKLRLQTLTSSEHTPNQHHLFEPIQTLKDIAREPILAMGLGGEHGPIPQFPHDTVPHHVVHNTWLYIWMKLGLAGILLFVWASSRYLRCMRHYVRQAREDFSRPMILAFASMVPLLFMQFLTGPVPWYPHQTCLIVLFVSVTVKLITMESAACQ